MKDKISTIHRMQSFLIENAKQVYQCFHLEFFDVFIHPIHSFSYLNYAIPTKPISNKFEEEYSKIEKVFLENNRQVRFEFLEDVSPQLPTQLSVVGLNEEYRTDFMICVKDSFCEPLPIDDFSVQHLSGNSSVNLLNDFRFVQTTSFDEDSQLTIDAIDSQDVADSIGTGAGFIGLINDKSVSACQYTSIIKGITELVGTATLANYRTRGYGSLVVAEACKYAFGASAEIICLTSANEKVSKMYGRIGFEKIGTMLAYS